MMIDASILLMGDTSKWDSWPILPVVLPGTTDSSGIAIVIDTGKGLALYEGVNLHNSLARLRTSKPEFLTCAEIHDKGWRAV